MSIDNDVFKLCPFCYNDSNFKVECSRKGSRGKGNERQSRYHFYVRCNECLAKGPAVSIWIGDTIDAYKFGIFEELEQEAILLWNRRCVKNG